MKVVLAVGFVLAAGCMAEKFISEREPESEKSSQAALHASQEAPKVRRLVLVGGGDDSEILRYLASCGKVVTIMPGAASNPEATYNAYAQDFLNLGKEVQKLNPLEPREADFSCQNARILARSDVIWFPGGDQRDLVTRVGNRSWISERIQKLYNSGGTIAGTSAGASAIGEIMPYKEGEFPGFGLMKKTIIDQHFTGRNRAERLLKLLKLHPGFLGIGLDKRGAVLVEDETTLKVIGPSAVHIAFDGTRISHVLKPGDLLNLKTRQPSHSP